MALLTRIQCKGFLNIASVETSFDTLIDNLLPSLPEKVFTICNNPFPANKFDTDLYVISRSQGVFVASTATVTVLGQNFETDKFAAAQDLFIVDSYRNDGFYTIDSVSSSTLTIASAITATGAFNEEASGASITFAVVQYPPGIKPLAASLVQFDYQERGTWKEADGALIGVYGYPRALLRDFAWYTRPRFL